MGYWNTEDHGAKANDNYRRIASAHSRSAQIADDRKFLSRRLRSWVHIGIGLPTIDRDEPGLVILSAQSADIALIEAVGARRLWPDSKIILLYEYASPADFQKLLTSELNGCVSWSVSPETLISTLDLIVTRDLRLMVAADANIRDTAVHQTNHIRQRSSTSRTALNTTTYQLA